MLARAFTHGAGRALIGTIFVAWTGWATPAQAQRDAAGTGVLAGLVHDSAGTGLGDVAITVVNGRTGAETPGHTVFNGRFAIAGLQLGVPYTVRLAKMEYSPLVVDSLVIPASKVLRVDYTMRLNRTRQLEQVSVTGSAKGSKLARKTLDANEIAKAKVSTALDAIQRLRPIMLAPSHDVCITNDSLSLYVDGIRRPVYNSSNQGTSAPRIVQGQGMNHAQRTVVGRTNEEIVRDALAEIPSDDVGEVTFVGCDEYNAKIQHRNVIWLLTKRYQANAEKTR